MGLPSGNRWAVSNLDVTVPYFFPESPFQYECSFFSWGNVTPHNPIDESSFSYNFGDVNPASPWFDGQPYGSTPGAQLTGDIPLDMDAARSLLGGPWHMPSRADFSELIAYCDYIDADGNVIASTKADKRVTVNDVMGIYLQSKINGNRLFFACSGAGGGTSWAARGISGGYWSNSFFSERNAYFLNFNTNSVTPQGNSSRNGGRAIRPIWNPRDLRG